MWNQRSIVSPFGVTTSGSHVIRVEPDLASIDFSVSREESQPKDAFREARAAAENVQGYLERAGFDDYGTSRINLHQVQHHIADQLVSRYVATIDFRMVLKQLDRLEEALVGVTDAGANQIGQVEYRTSKRKELQAQARERAVVAAREKAEAYCRAAGVGLGPVLHIEDVDSEQGGVPMMRELAFMDAKMSKAFNPGNIEISGAVMVAFGIVRADPQG